MGSHAFGLGPATPIWQHLGVALTQTLVQLSEELLAQLDTRVAREGRSRSELICEALAGYLSFEDREAEIDRLMIEGYTRRPQEDRLGADAAARAMVAGEPWEQPAR
ncbi:MAG: Ribbon-helix-helix protein copG family [Solirubrobacteraceae bacterium]|nr:Ribbon-helix-helix protein copG family [Solirubrobacteraceae bacterium]